MKDYIAFSVQFQGQIFASAGKKKSLKQMSQTSYFMINVSVNVTPMTARFRHPRGTRKGLFSAATFLS